MRTGRSVIVTGAAGGMGSRFVQRFLDNGDTVVAGDSDGPGLDRLKSEMEVPVGLFTAVEDISDEAGCDRLADLARAERGRVDVLVNCAGYFPITPFAGLTADVWRRVVAVNLTGPFLMIKAVHPLMTGRGWGRIVNIGSASVFGGVADQSPYVSAKAGLLGLTRSLARAFGGDGITVNVVTPGLTATPPVLKSMPAEMLKNQIKVRAVPRQEEAGDLVGAVFFLASPDADFISGQTVNVDGGSHML